MKRRTFLTSLCATIATAAVGIEIGRAEPLPIVAEKSEVDFIELKPIDMSERDREYDEFLKSLSRYRRLKVSDMAFRLDQA